MLYAYFAGASLHLTARIRIYKIYDRARFEWSHSVENV